MPIEDVSWTGRNTYYFYRKGHRGVLVEPNVTICKKLEAVRPEDTTLVAGIGVTAVTEADYLHRCRKSSRAPSCVSTWTR